MTALPSAEYRFFVFNMMRALLAMICGTAFEERVELVRQRIGCGCCVVRGETSMALTWAMETRKATRSSSVSMLSDNDTKGS